MSDSHAEPSIRPQQIAETPPGSPWLKELYDVFAPVREEAAQYSDEEIHAAIDEAVGAVRRRRSPPRPSVPETGP